MLELTSFQVSVTSYRTAYIDRTPIVSFHDVEEPLLTPKSGHLSGEPSHTHRSPPSSRPLGSKTPQSLARSFQIGNLSTPTRRPENANYQSPAPPPDDQYEFDAMDIDTPQKSFHPAPSIHLHQPTPKRPEQPSPFYGRLPPAPRSMEHKLRNPPTHQIQIPSSQENFFGASRDSVSPVSTKAGDPLDSPVSPRQFDMAAPRFFAPSKNDEVTGLESLFAGIFSLKDEPAELRAAQAKQDEEKHSGGRVSRPWKQLSNIALLAGSGLSWLYATKYPQYTTTLYFASLSASCLVSGRHLVSSLSLNLPFWTLSDILLYTIEAVIATGLAYEVHKTRLNERTVIDSLRWIPQFYFICMLVQELLLIGKAIRSKPRNSTPHLHSKSTTTSPRNPSSLPVEQNPSFKPRPSAPSIEKNFKTPTKATTSQMQLHERQTPRTSRTKEKPARQSSGMSGLGLGNSPDRGGTNTRTEVWNGNQNSRVLRRQVPPWERGSM